MKVVFLEEVEGTARAGDVKTVADGFARNFLLPRKLAAPATDHYMSIAQAKAGKEARKQDRLDEEARTHLLSKVDRKSISIEVRVGEQEKLFGSVTARDIAEALQTATKVELDHRQVVLREPLREIGEHAVIIKLTRNVHATVTVSVEPLGGMPVAEAPAEVEMEVAEESGMDEPEEAAETAEPTSDPDAEESEAESIESEVESASEES